MNELIQITTDAQGASVVSARDLHTALESKRQFADWIKGRIEKYGLIKDQDYTTFSQLSEKGRPTTEYALTLDAAKELSMVEGNERGKQVRQFFINAEKERTQLLRQPLPGQLSTEQMLVQLAAQTNQLLINQQEVINQLRADVDAIKAGERPALPLARSSRAGRQLGLPGMPAPNPATRPNSSLRSLINQRVTEYSGLCGATTQETYKYLYKRLREVYNIDVYRLQRPVGEPLLDVLERYSLIDRLYSLVTVELDYSGE